MNNNQQTGPPWFTAWIIASVIQMLFCSVLGGAGCLILTILADSDYKQGKFTEAENKHKLLPLVLVGGIITSLIGCGILYFWSIEIIKEIFTV